MDDIFALFASPESVHLFREYMFSKQQSINFSLEHKKLSSRSFSNVNIRRKNDKFVTSVYREPTFFRVFTLE